MAEGTAALRAAAAHWSLAGDQQLLNLLQDIHQRIVARCNETTERLDRMAKGLRDASVNLQNVNNKFLALSNTQFVESRVYEDDTDVTAAPVVSKEPPQISDLTSELSKLKQSLHILEGYHEPLHILRDSDSDTDSEEDDDRLVLKAKDLYAERPLPFVIGTPQWKAKWHAGLVAEDSDTDSSASQAEEVDQYSESDDEPSKADIITPQRKVSSGSSSLLSEVVPASPGRPSPADVAAEIARRLGGDVKIPEREPVYNEPETVVRKLYKPQQPTATIFPEEPPPLEESADEDIFAELHKTHNSHGNNVQKDLFDFSKKNNDLEQALFGGSEQEPVSTESQKPPLLEGVVQPEVKNTPENILNEENTKKPVGGISLFGTNKHAECIGAAILKRNQRTSSTSGEESNTEEVKEVKDVKHKEVKKERDIFDDLFAKSEKLNKKNEQKEVKKVAQKQVKEVKKEDKKDLFSDLFDDIDDIFSGDIVVKNNKYEKPLFNDDDDLFAEVSNIKAIQKEKDNIVSKTNLFEVKAKAEKLTETKINTVNELKKEAKGLFDSDSDDGLFSKEKPKVTEQKSKPVEHKINDDIFGDDDDDLFSKKKPVKEVKSLSKTVDKGNALFDSDDELFSSKTDPQKKDNTSLQNKANNILNTAEKKPAKTYINTEDIFNREEKSKALEVIESINNDIFNDGDELFKRTENTKPNDEKLLTDNKSSVKTDLKPEGNTKIPDVVENVKDNTIEDNDELFTRPERNKIPSIKSINEILDDEDGDELFENNKKVETTKITSIKPIDKISDDEDNDELFTSNTKTEPSKVSNIESINSILEDEDIFSNNKSVDKNKIASESKDTQLIKDDFTNEPINDFYKTYEQESNIRTTRIASDVEIPKVNKVKNDIFDDADDELFKTPINKTKTDDENKEKTEPADAVTTDIFSDIFDDVPPLFEKPKESKKSKNVNALFDDDSDDETLFFKKNDVISDEKPDICPSEERFGIFNDEPPAIEIDFTQKSNKTDITEIPQKAEEIFDSSTDSLISEKIENITPKIDKTRSKISEDTTDNTTKEPKKVGKLKPMNFNINVNTLLPGASPKKKVEEEKSSSNEELHITDKIEPPLVKSVSFDDPEILDNKISKERAKIQVKRRPSTRRARKEAVRKSAIDVTDSLDSPEDPVKVKTVYILNDADIFGDVENAKTIETKKHLNIVDSDEELFKKSYDKSEKDFLDKNNDIFNDENSQINEVKHETKSFTDESEDLFKSSTSIQTISKSSKENIINKTDNENEKVSERKSFLDSDDDDDELFKTKASKPALTNYSSDEDLFKPKKGIETLGKVYETKDTKVNTNIEKKPHNIFDDFPPTPIDVTETEIIKPADIIKEKPKEIVRERAVKSILDESSDEDDLFKSKTKLPVKKEGRSLFGDDLDDGDDLFGQKATKEQKQDIPAPQSAKELKAAETVFVDPLSLFGDEE